MSDTSSNVPAYTVLMLVRNFAGAIDVFSSKLPVTNKFPVLVNLDTGGGVL
jgi:hypothetical protein